MEVIDVHTHMFSKAYFDLLLEAGAPRYTRVVRPSGRVDIESDGVKFLSAMPGHLDYELRIRDMDDAGVDVAIVTLTAPNCFFGDERTSLRAAQLVNDDMAQAQSDHPDRIRWMCSVPWEHPDTAVAELDRACEAGAIGVMVLANINGRSLTEPAFERVWEAIDKRGLPVLVHPTTPPGYTEMDINVHNLTGSVGFMFDTTLAISRMIFDGFLDRFPNLKLIASHAGGTLPYIVGRLDRCFDMDEGRRTKISTRPSEYLRRIYYDAVTYRLESLKLCIEVGGVENVMYGSDYPHTIGDMKGCLERVDALPQGQVDAVRGGNAKRIFGL